MNRKVSAMFLSMLFIGILSLESNIHLVKASNETSETEPNIEVIDFHNGTRSMVIDYGNGTIDQITETFLRKNAELQVSNTTINQSLTGQLQNLNQVTTNSSTSSLQALQEEPTQYANTTQTFTFEQEVLMGFTYNIIKERYDIIDVRVLIAYARAGIDVDITFGLRLPINVTLEYPEQMTIGNNYTLYATLDPTDKPSFNEFVFTFKAYIWVEAGIWTPLGWINYRATYGPDIDESKSFETPLGREAEAPLPGIEITVFDSAWVISFSLLQVFLTIEPAFGSERIAAKASTVGDSRVVEGENLTWSSPNERLNFTVNTDDYDPATNHTKIRISEFKYYFTLFKLNVGLLFDFHSWIDWLTGDPSIKVATLDLSWIIEKIGVPYLGGHSGYPNSVYIILYVERIILPPETTEPRDITIFYATIYPTAVYPGRIINITVAVANLGNVTETFNVTVRYDNVTIGMQSVTGLGPNENIILIFSWNTTGLPECHRCYVFAEASSIPNEIDMDDNILITSMVKIKMFGDINNDDKVDMKDIGLVASTFGAFPGHARWDSETDGNEDNRIDLRDIGIACVNFGKHYP